MILAIIAKIGVAGGDGHVLEYAGATFRKMSMDGAYDGVQYVD